MNAPPKVNGRWTIGLLTSLLVLALGTSATILISENGRHDALARDLQQAKIKCMEERSLDRQRIARVEQAVITTAAELERIRKAIERLEK